MIKRVLSDVMDSVVDESVEVFPVGSGNRLDAPACLASNTTRPMPKATEMIAMEKRIQAPERSGGSRRGLRLGESKNTKIRIVFTTGVFDWNTHLE